jgi:hypothetical protein
LAVSAGANTIFHSGNAIRSSSDLTQEEVRALDNIARLSNFSMPVAFHALFGVTLTLEEMMSRDIFSRKSQQGSGSRRPSKISSFLKEGPFVAAVNAWSTFMSRIRPDQASAFKAYSEFWARMAPVLSGPARMRFEYLLRQHYDLNPGTTILPIPQSLSHEYMWAMFHGLVADSFCPRCLEPAGHTNGTCPVVSTDTGSQTSSLDRLVAASMAPLMKRVSSLEGKKGRPKGKSNQRPGTQRKNGSRPASGWKAVCLDFNGSSGCNRATCRFDHTEGCNFCQSFGHKHDGAHSDPKNRP